MLMTQKAVLNRQQPSNDTGKHTYIKEYITCRVELRQAIFKTPEGKDVISLGIVYMTDEPTINDKVTWKDKTYTIKHVYDVIDIYGVIDHYKCWLI